jgi:hypothetical protein
LSKEIFLGCLLAAILCVIFHLAAGTVYDFHYKLKKDGSPLSKFLTGDIKNIDDKEKWVRRYRAKMLFLLAVITAIPLFKHFIS